MVGARGTRAGGLGGRWGGGQGARRGGRGPGPKAAAGFARACRPVSTMSVYGRCKADAGFLLSYLIYLSTLRNKKERKKTTTSDHPTPFEVGMPVASTAFGTALALGAGSGANSSRSAGGVQWVGCDVVVGEGEVFFSL